MKRYGDNLPSASLCEDELSIEHGRNVMVMYGGCGVGFGTFSKPVVYSQKRKTLDIRSLLGFRKNKTTRKSG